MNNIEKGNIVDEIEIKQMLTICELTSFLLLQAVNKSVCAAVVGEMKSSNTSRE